MKIFLRYLKQHIKSILLFCFFTGIFILVFYLENVPITAVVYASLLCLTFAIIIAFTGFALYYRKHRRLEDCTNSILISLKALPESGSPIEEDYIALIRILYDEKCRMDLQNTQIVSEMTDYYTLWAHQIKTPIAAMRLLLQSGDVIDNNELDEQLFKIEQYVEMVMQYLRTEGTVSDYVIKPYKLDDIVRQAVRKYAKQFIRKKIALNYDGIETEVVTDEKWLSFAIEQFLSNALKYTNEGSISIYMSGTNKNTLCISDTGIGITEEDLPKVCEKGYTGFNGRSDKKSTGIGLYLCSQILKKLSHTLNIRSTVGKGTTIEITFTDTNLTKM